MRKTSTISRLLNKQPLRLKSHFSILYDIRSWTPHAGLIRCKGQKLCREILSTPGFWGPASVRSRQALRGVYRSSLVTKGWVGIGYITKMLNSLLFLYYKGCERAI